MRSKKLNIAFLGSGMIAIDLLIKAMRLENLNCLLVAGRNYHSKGMKIAKKIGVSTSDCGIDAIMEQQSTIDLVFDATSAKYHKVHAPIFKKLGIKCIDLTPAKIGPMCIPSVNSNECLNEININMVSGGGQA